MHWPSKLLPNVENISLKITPINSFHYVTWCLILLNNRNAENFIYSDLLLHQKQLQPNAKSCTQDYHIELG